MASVFLRDSTFLRGTTNDGDDTRPTAHMKVSLSSEFRFEASHRLGHLAPDHPCYRLHGHSYSVVIEITGDVDDQSGFLVDYREIAQAAEPIISRLDHTHLNDVDGLDIATTEYIARWLWQRIKPDLQTLSKISVSETPSTRCDYRGD